MDKITSAQGKEFNYSDILSYYRVGKEQIIVLLNDKEQFKKFAVTRRKEDFPTANLSYSTEMFEKVILDMKQIKDYPPNPDGTIRVEYEDGTTINFDKNSKGVIESIVIEQRKAKEKAKTFSANLSNFVGDNIINNSNSLELQSLEHTNVEKNGRRFKVIKAENINELKEGNTQIAMYAMLCAMYGLITLMSIVNGADPLLIGLNGVAEFLFAVHLGKEIGKKTILKDIEKKFEEVELQIKNENNKSRGGK